MSQEVHEELLHFRNGGQVSSKQIGRERVGAAPAVLLINPKYPHNVGAAIRAASCYGISQVWYTGNRVPLMSESVRIPREERMRAYEEVTLYQYDRPFDQFVSATPIAIELHPNTETLPNFKHPANGIYVFGPEDGDLGRVTLQHCHRFVVIPTRHCLNLGAAIATVLYDRHAKLENYHE